MSNLFILCLDWAEHEYRYDIEAGSTLTLKAFMFIESNVSVRQPEEAARIGHGTCRVNPNHLVLTPETGAHSSCPESSPRVKTIRHPYYSDFPLFRRLARWGDEDTRRFLTRFPLGGTVPTLGAILSVSWDWLPVLGSDSFSLSLLG